MIAYLIKSGLFLAILLLVYLALLEKEKMHQFNRFFLLTVLIAGLTVPMFSIDTVRNKLVTETPTEIVNSIASASSVFAQKVVEYPSNRTKTARSTLDNRSVLNSREIAYERNFSYHFLTGLVIIVYVMVCFFLFLRMGIGLYSFYKKRKKNPRLSFKSAQLVLVKEPVSPHSFLNTIFVNKNQYKSGEISDKIFEHEFAHIQQKHSLDILFIELLRIIFWFNPLFYFYKKAIQINHEFLADESVLNKTNDLVSYKSLLMKSVLPSYKTSLSSSFNYTLTKKRFMMMVKKSSLISTLSRKMVLIPMLGSLALIFGTEVLQERRTYEINGEKYFEAYQEGSLDSDIILLNKTEEMKESKQFHKWTYYDDEGNPFTGEWVSDANIRGKKISTRSEIEGGKLLSRVKTFEDQGVHTIMRDRFKGDTVSSTFFNGDYLISGGTTLIYKPEKISIILTQSLNKDGLWGQLFKVGNLPEGNTDKEIYVNTTFDSSWNITEQGLFGEDGELALTRHHKEILIKDAKLRYKESLSEYKRVLSKNKPTDAELVYAELKLAHSKWLAFRRDLDAGGEIPQPLPPSPVEQRGK